MGRSSCSNQALPEGLPETYSENYWSHLGVLDLKIHRQKEKLSNTKAVIHTDMHRAVEKWLLDGASPLFHSLQSQAVLTLFNHKSEAPWQKWHQLKKLLRSSGSTLLMQLRRSHLIPTRWFNVLGMQLPSDIVRPTVDLRLCSKQSCYWSVSIYHTLVSIHVDSSFLCLLSHTGIFIPISHTCLLSQGS